MKNNKRSIESHGGGEKKNTAYFGLAAKVACLVALGTVIAACGGPVVSPNLATETQKPGITDVPVFPKVTLTPFDPVTAKPVLAPFKTDTQVPPFLVPSRTPSPVPTPTPNISALVSPFVERAMEIRSREAKNNPQYGEAVDPNLAALGVTFLVLGCGIDHEPPNVEMVYICSNSVVLLRYDGSATILTYTHDTRAPEAEEAAGILGKPGSAMRLEQAWFAVDPNTKKQVGGPGLLRKTFQNATGLPIDYEIVVQDGALLDLVDAIDGKWNNEGKIDITIPVGFRAQPIYIDDKTKLPAREFKAGKQQLTGPELMQYVKAIVAADWYPPELENNIRKHTAMEALLDNFRSRLGDPRYWMKGQGGPRLTGFLLQEMKNGRIYMDTPLDMEAVIRNIINASAQKMLAGQSPLSTIPGISGELYLADPAVTGNPNSKMRWGNKETGDPYILQDLKEGAYQQGYVEVPLDGNPYSGHLARDYWRNPRAEIREFILKNGGN